MSDCIEYQGYRNRDGYGIRRHKGKLLLAKEYGVAIGRISLIGLKKVRASAHFSEAPDAD